MAVHIKLIRNNIKSSSSYGKYFAKAVSQGEVTMNELAEEAAINSGISRGAFIRGVTELQDMMKHRLANGQTVVIEGIGRFSLRVESIGVEEQNSSILDDISSELSVVSFQQVAASTSVKGPRTATSSTTSARVSRPYGRRGLNHNCYNIQTIHVLIGDILYEIGDQSKKLKDIHIE